MSPLKSALSIELNTSPHEGFSYYIDFVQLITWLSLCTANLQQANRSNKSTIIYIKYYSYNTYAVTSPLKLMLVDQEASICPQETDDVVVSWPS
jgi:hypothetical protein